MSQLPGNPNLPPGCTSADVDRTGASPHDENCCSECGYPFDYDEKQCRDEETCDECSKLSPCCGVDYDKDTELCPQCREHI